jgi:hypothetical protein
MNTHQIRENIRLFTKTHTILLVLILLSFTFKNYNLTYILGVCFLANCVRTFDDINAKMISLFFFCYYFIPLPNISTYRGTISYETLQLYTLMIIIGMMPLMFKYKIKKQRLNENRIIVNKAFENVVSGHLVFVYLLLFYTLNKYGNILIQQELRFTLSPYIVYLIKSSIYIPLFYAFIKPKDRTSLVLIKYTVLPLLPALFIGSRGTVISILIAVGLITILNAYKSNEAYSVNNINVWAKFRKIIYSLISLILIIIHFFYYSRRIFSDNLISNMEVVKKYFDSDSPLYLVILPLYTSFRETIGIANSIITKGLENNVTSIPLFGAELLTVLPGFQPSPGKIIGDIVGRKLGGGLTPNILGGVYLDFGVLAIFSCIIFIALIKYFYTKSNYSDSYKIIYAITITQFFHLFHRGFLKPEYFFAYIIIFFYLFILSISQKKMQ